MKFIVLEKTKAGTGDKFEKIFSTLVEAVEVAKERWQYLTAAERAKTDMIAAAVPDRYGEESENGVAFTEIQEIYWQNGKAVPVKDGWHELGNVDVYLENGWIVRATRDDYRGLRPVYLYKPCRGDGTIERTDAKMTEYVDSFDIRRFGSIYSFH